MPLVRSFARLSRRLAGAVGLALLVAACAGVPVGGGTPTVSAATEHAWGLSVRDFGAAGDDRTDDTVAFQAAIDAAAGAKPLVVPAGTYRISAPLNAKSGRLNMIGAGIGLTVIHQAADNAPILRMGGANNHVAGMSLRYVRPQPIGNTGANAIEFHADFQSVYERIEIYRANRGMYVAQEPVNQGSNWVFSTSFRDIRVVYYSNNGIHLSGFNGGISGNVMSNIYLLGRGDMGEKLETNQALYLGAWGNGHLSQINIESSKPVSEAVFLDTCNGLVIDGLHFEQVELRTDFSAFVHANNGGFVFNNVTVEFSQITAPRMLAIFRGGTVGGKRPIGMRVTGLTEAYNTVTTPNWWIFLENGGASATPGNSFSADLVYSEGLTGPGISALTPSSILPGRHGF